MRDYSVFQLPGWRRQAYAWALSAVLGVAALSSLGGVPPALAQSEPTINQIYDTARAGKLTDAQTMVEQVLAAHPQSAKAHYVQAELFARQGNAARGREALAQADKLAPGLPFASAEAVQALRRQLSAKPASAATSTLGNTDAGRDLPANAALPAPTRSSFPLGLGLALGGAAIGAAIYVSRRSKTPAAPLGGGSTNSAGFNAPPNAFPPAPVPPGGSGLSGPQTFGMGSAGAGSYGAAGGFANGYGQTMPAAGAPAATSGMGGRLAGGLATGLAVGAGVMAAQAIGNSFAHRGDGNSTASEHANKASGDNAAASNPGSLAGDAGQPGSVNNDLGGQNFGMNDQASAGGWDDVGSQDSFSADLGGGDWDA